MERRKSATVRASGTIIPTEPLLYVLKPSAGKRGREYGEFRGPVARASLPRSLVPGSIVALRPRAECSWTDLATGIETVQKRVINAPAVLWPDCVGHDRAVELSAKARAGGVRCVVWRAQPDRERLKRQLTDPYDWGLMVVLWLRNRGCQVPPETGQVTPSTNRAITVRLPAPNRPKLHPAQLPWIGRTLTVLSHMGVDRRKQADSARRRKG
jgi:hypothetical protein